MAGRVATVDAPRGYPNTAPLIVDGGSDHVVPLKDNHPTLLDDKGDERLEKRVGAVAPLDGAPATRKTALLSDSKPIESPSRQPARAEQPSSANSGMALPGSPGNQFSTLPNSNVRAMLGAARGETRHD